MKSNETITHQMNRRDFLAGSAPSYNQGKCEEAYGKLLAGSSAKRNQVFLTTKISSFNQRVGQMYQDVFKGLPLEKQNAIRQHANELRQQRAVEKPGYYLTYFPNQQNGFNLAYLRAAMLKDYQHKVEGSQSCRQFITESLEASLKRVGTDYFDIMMCPHGADSPEDLQCHEIVETFQQLKKQGKVRFLGVTSHNDPAGVLRAATAAGYYDVAMFAYNVINGGYLEDAMQRAAASGMGLIAMKAAHAVATHHKALQPIPEWRVQKIHRVIPGEMKAPMKAYLWALQNPHLSAVISNLWNANYIKENLRTLPLRFSYIRADGTNNFDLSLFKNYQITEKFRIQFRAESFNALNHVQFGGPTTGVVNTAFGTITGEKGHGQRQWTFGLKLLF